MGNTISAFACVWLSCPPTYTGPADRVTDAIEITYLHQSLRRSRKREIDGSRKSARAPLRCHAAAARLPQKLHDCRTAQHQMITLVTARNYPERIALPPV